MHFPLPIRAAALALSLAAGACGDPAYTPVVPVGGPVDFTIDGLSFHVSSGGIYKNGQQFTLYFTNQPNTCMAVAAVPQQIFIIFSLEISPAADGSLTAEVVPPRLTFPPNGQAAGTLVQTNPIQGPTTTLDTESGSVAWQANADGSVTITRLDVSFAGTADRLKFVLLTVPVCN